jgi:hypothetical protein
MEEKIAAWSVAVVVAGFVALMIYGCTMDFIDGETIRETAETGVVFIALGVTTTFLKG